MGQGHGRYPSHPGVLGRPRASTYRSTPRLAASLRPWAARVSATARDTRRWNLTHSAHLAGFRNSSLLSGAKIGLTQDRSSLRMEQGRRMDSRAMDLRLAFGARQRSPEVDESVTEDSETDPTLHACVAFIAAARESVAPLQQTDPALAASPPFLRLFEPACLLFQLSLATLRGPVGHRHPFDPHALCRRLRRRRVEPR